MTLYKWSQTASADATADSTINWAEGQSPSSVNDSARAMMAAIAKYRDDIAGAIVTSGTNTAYVVNSYQVFQSLSQLNGQVIAFTPHATNGATVTINVDGLGAKPLRSAPGGELPAGTIIQGTPYAALYNNGDAAFYLMGFFNNPYNMPIGCCIDFFGAIAPNSSFVLAYGQGISRTAYSTLFSMFGTTYGVGDGSTTFNIPDLRGRIIAGRDDMGGSAASRLTSSYFGGSASNLGAVGGSESHTLTTAQLASHVHANSLTDLGHQHGGGQASVQTAFGGTNSGAQVTWGGTAQNTSSATTGITITNASAGSGNPHNNTQPTIIANKLLRII
ncbi:phage tail protein [Bradyrhizobium commune]|uniref:Tail fiber protein n=1 Tax=Bradyrhizobium commune TaxID=83627 RepID=A0A7S9D9M3_9BRAD|nr:tail fiber protein [Bradyrhizobium commune]QPF93788.1 tail fiber protein [Bradyrhizobium commune]